MSAESKPVLSFSCDVCGDEIDFPAYCGDGEDYTECEPGCSLPDHLVVQEDAKSTCDHCGAVGRISADGEYAYCVIDEDDPAWVREFQRTVEGV